MAQQPVATKKSEAPEQPEQPTFSGFIEALIKVFKFHYERADQLPRPFENEAQNALMAGLRKFKNLELGE